MKRSNNYQNKMYVPLSYFKSLNILCCVCLQAKVSQICGLICGFDNGVAIEGRVACCQQA